MNKEQTLEAIENARNAHIMQMEKIESLLKGEEVKDPTAVAKTECMFGKWFYEEQNHIEDILGSQFYENIEVLHDRWHREYLRVFEIFFKEKKGGFFSKIFKSAAVDEMELDKAKLYYSELQLTTNELLKVLASSQRRLNALKESKFY